MAKRESKYEVIIGVTVLKDIGEGIYEKTASFGDGAAYGAMNIADVTALENWFLESGAKKLLSEGLDPILRMLGELGIQQLMDSGEFTEELGRIERGLAALAKGKAAPPKAG